LGVLRVSALKNRRPTCLPWRSSVAVPGGPVHPEGRRASGEAGWRVAPAASVGDGTVTPVLQGGQPQRQAMRRTASPLAQAPKAATSFVAADRFRASPIHLFRGFLRAFAVKKLLDHRGQNTNTNITPDGRRLFAVKNRSS